MKKLVFLILLLFLAGCAKNGTEIIENYEPPSYMKGVALTTDDGITVKGTKYLADSDKSIILLHRLNQDRNSWSSLPLKFHEKGYNVIAIDLRGHGESQGNWKDFSDQDFTNMVLDAKAAKQAVGGSQFIVMGESIGANTALNYAATDNDVKGVVLLSPGLNYRGIHVEDTTYNGNILIWTAESDTYSAQSSQEIKNKNPQAELKVFAGKLHGTPLITSETEEMLFDFVETTFSTQS